MNDNRNKYIPGIAMATMGFTLPGCTKDAWYGLGYDILRQHDCQQQADVPENAGCKRIYRDEYERYKRDRKMLLNEEI